MKYYFLQENKLISDWINWLLIVSGWLRFWVFILLAQTFSNLLNTFKKMVDSTTYFNFIIVGLLVFFVSIFYTLFAFQDPPRFGTFFYTTRSDFDALTGAYSIVDYVYNKIKILKSKIQKKINSKLAIIISNDFDYFLNSTSTSYSIFYLSFQSSKISTYILLYLMVWIILLI